MLQKFYVNPDTAWDAMNAVQDNGDDYEFILEGGAYALPNSSTLNLSMRQHQGGGGVVIRALIAGDVTIDANASGAQPHTFEWGGDSFRMHGLRWKGLGWDEYFADTSQSVSTLRNFSLGGYYPSDATVGIPPRIIEITNCEWEGTLNVPILIAYASNDSDFYTDLRTENITATDLHRTWLTTRQMTGDDGYYHLYLRDITTHGVSGPDRLSEWPSSPEAVTYSPFASSPMMFDVYRQSGESTAEVRECHGHTEIRGSDNHDMHVFRWNFVQSASVVNRVRDCVFSGEWSRNHFIPPGQNNKFMHLGYYHFNNTPDWPVGGRPLFDFENVKFKGIVNAAVSPDHVSENPVWPNRELFWCNESADFHFTDCDFEWDIQHGAYQNENVHGIALRSDNVDVVANNVTFTSPTGSLFLQINYPGVVYTTTEETRGYKDFNWLRRGVSTLPSKTNLAVDGSFEGSRWNPDANSSIVAVHDARDGKYVGRVSMQWNNPDGSGNYLGNISSQDAIAVETGATYHVRFRYKYRKLWDFAPSGNMSLILYVNYMQVYPGNQIDLSTHDEDTWYIFQASITAAGDGDGTIVASWAGSGSWFSEQHGYEVDIDQIEVYRA